MLYIYDHPEYFSNIPQPEYEKVNGNIIIFGAGVNGAIVLALLKKRKINILCFADDDSRKSGTEYLGYPVISRDDLINNYSNAAVIVTPYVSGTIFENLMDEGIKQVYDCTPLLLRFETDDVKNYVSPIYDIFHCIQTFLNKRSHISHALTVVITERCSLKCCECMAFIPYYEKPQDYNLDMLYKSLDCVLPTGMFPDIYLEGGEPLLHNDFEKIILKLLSYNEVEHIWIITNGTIIPDDHIIKTLKSPKIIVWISDYGKYSNKMEELKEKLKANSISHHSTTHHWYQVTRAHNYERTAEENQNVYNTCCKGLLVMNPFLIKGKIYRCQFHARSEEFDVIPTCEMDSIDIFKEREHLKDALNEFFLREEYMEACKYCCGRGYTSIEVPVAEQVVGAMPPLIKIKDV